VFVLEKKLQCAPTCEENSTFFYLSCLLLLLLLHYVFSVASFKRRFFRQLASVMFIEKTGHLCPEKVI
jgi:hypothetical protein